MRNKIDWIIHYCANGIACADCGKIETGYLPYTCNAHTHVLAKYGQMDFQIVLDMPLEQIGYILNSLGSAVQKGERFCAGETVSFGDKLFVKLAEYDEAGRKVLRLLFADRWGRFPDQPGCMKAYTLQLKKTDDLYYGGIHLNRHRN